MGREPSRVHRRPAANRVTPIVVLAGVLAIVVWSIVELGAENAWVPTAGVLVALVLCYSTIAFYRRILNFQALRFASQ